jgi:hypothetical protein
MHYHVVFDVAQSGYRFWWAPAAGLLLIAVGALLFLCRINTRAFGAAFLAFAMARTLLSLGLTLTDYLSLRAAMRNNECQIVEGVVMNFDPMPAEGHKDESFVVNGERFQYSDYDITAGFNRSRSHGGPIENGIPVRISYVKGNNSRNQIARLEIAD